MRLGCSVILLTSSLQTDWCHLIPSIVIKHNWSRASILCTSTLVTAQHSDPYRKIGRIQVLYSFSFAEIEIRDLQKWLSRLCIAVRLIPLQCMMLGVLCVNKWTREPSYTNSSTTATCWPWTMMVDGTFTLVPTAWTFVFCQFTSNPSEVASLAIVSSTATRSSTSSASREISLTNFTGILILVRSDRSAGLLS